MKKNIELSIIMPCLNEAETLSICINKANNFLQKENISGEIIIADNGSTDGSQNIVAEHDNTRLVHIRQKGYGSALMGGISSAQGKYIIMGDADDSYDFNSLLPFIQKLREGFDLVMGNRFKGGIKPNAMPFLHKYLGNPVLTYIGRLFFKSPSGDFHCGLRGGNKEAIKSLNLQTTGMEFASEMVIKATLFGMRITEVPTTLSPDGRNRPPHLRTWRDGWRHLRFMLLYSPKWLFYYPGLILMILGVCFGTRLLIGPVGLGAIQFDVQTLLFVATAIIIGYQAMLFGIFTKVYAINEGLLPRDSLINKFPDFLFKLEIGIVIGAVLFICGLVGAISAVMFWGEISSFGPLNARISLRIIVPSITALIFGLQTILGSFFLSILNLRLRKNYPSSGDGA